MAFVKVLKNKAYSKRYQTKFRRRREGKTDYFARRRLTFQNKDKYESKKYRLVVRRTNKRIIVSVNYATLTGDHTMVNADSSELKTYGLKAGLTNYSAAYCTGLLAARRLLNLKKMDDMYKGNTKVDGDLYSVVDDMGDRRPFKAFLDIGLVRTTTGNRVFGALKGACDGGLHVPHNEKRFPGYHVEKVEVVTNKRGKAMDAEKSSGSLDAKEHKAHIFGEHVETYYNKLKSENAQLFKKQFNRWEKALKDAKVSKFADLYKKVHEAIRKSPARAAKAKKAAAVRTVVNKAPTLVMKNSKGKTWLRQQKIGIAARKERVQKKIATLLA